MLDDPTIDCQDCGRILRHLSPAEAQKVAANPYNFVFWCDDCSRGKMEFKFYLPDHLPPRSKEDDEAFLAQLTDLMSKPIGED
jgi:hypothetical protein